MYLSARIANGKGKITAIPDHPGHAMSRMYDGRVSDLKRWWNSVDPDSFEGFMEEFEQDFLQTFPEFEMSWAHMPQFVYCYINESFNKGEVTYVPRANRAKTGV